MASAPRLLPPARRAWSTTRLVVVSIAYIRQHRDLATGRLDCDLHGPGHAARSVRNATSPEEPNMNRPCTPASSRNSTCRSSDAASTSPSAPHEGCIPAARCRPANAGPELRRSRLAGASLSCSAVTASSPGRPPRFAWPQLLSHRKSSLTVNNQLKSSRGRSPAAQDRQKGDPTYGACREANIAGGGGSLVDRRFS